MSRIYFTDRNLGKQFPGLLSQSGVKVERHGDHFEPDGPDEQWLEYCGLHQRVALTCDARIRYVPNELAAVKRFQVQLLILIGKVTTAHLAQNFIRTLPRIEALLDEHAGPSICKVYLPTTELRYTAQGPAGRAEVWYPKK